MAAMTYVHLFIVQLDIAPIRKKNCQPGNRVLRQGRRSAECGMEGVIAKAVFHRCVVPCKETGLMIIIGKHQCIIGKRRKHQLKKATVMVLFLQIVTGFMLYVYSICMLCEKMHGFLWRGAEEQQHSQPQRTDNMDNTCKQ